MIFYFSGTGNTKWVAEELAARLNEKTVCITEKNAALMSYKIKEGENLGFCFPVHGWQPPRIVKDFVSNLNIDCDESTYCFAVCTCGDTTAKTQEILYRLLQKKGIRCNSFFSVVMPESYVCLPFMHTDTPEAEHRKIATARNTISQIYEAISNKKEYAAKAERGPLPFLFSDVIGSFFNKFMITDLPFTVDENVCIKCGKCKSVCPTDNIAINSQSLPQWKRNKACTCCLACYHHCPVHAINYGPITKRRGQYFFGHKNQQKK